MLLLLLRLTRPLWSPSSSGGPPGKSSARERTSPRPHDDDDAEDIERCGGLCGADQGGGCPTEGDWGEETLISLEAWRRRTTEQTVVHEKEGSKCG